MKGRRIGFIGAGSMAEALIHGLLNARLVDPDEVRICNRHNRERLRVLSETLGVVPLPGKAEVVAGSDLVILATKPKDLPEALLGIRSAVKKGQVFISVAAGVGTAFIEETLGDQVQVIRAMPNTSCVVGESATGLCRGRSAGREAEELAVRIFQCVGKAIVVPEEHLDSVTGLAGTGPAYVYLLMEAMIRAGVESGFSEAVSRDLVVQTVLGAAKMVADTGEDPGLLRQRVTSPGGTTVAAMQVLKERGFFQALVDAVHRASERSREMGESLIADFREQPSSKENAS